MCRHQKTPMSPNSPKRTAHRTGATPEKDGGQTKPVVDGKSAPKMPHEQDESADSQQACNVSTEQIGKQAFEDIDSGQVDTDRGSVTQRVYEGLKHKP